MVFQASENETVPVEDPRQLERVILHLVTNLPSLSKLPTPANASPTALRLTIIPPRKERIVSAIEKIYTVIKTIPKHPSILHEDTTPDEGFILSPNQNDLLQTESLLPLPFDHVYLQTQRSTQTDASCSPGNLSDSEYLPTDVAYDVIMPFNNNIKQMKFQMFPPQDNYSEQLYSEPILSGSSVAGMKRHKNYDQEEQETSTKKKGTGISHEQISDRSSPSLETFFDEASKYSVCQNSM